MKNKLTNLNDHLFMQLERLGDESLDADQIDQEVKRSGAMVQVADQIIANANLHLKAVKMVVDHGDHLKKSLPMIEDNSTPPIMQRQP